MTVNTTLSDTSERRTAIVTGGSRGLGRAITAALSARRWAVVFDGRDAGAVAEVAAWTGATGVAGDVRDRAHRVALVEAAAGAHGRLDLLVNNAGILGPSPLPRLAGYPLDQLAEVLSVNLVAQLGIIQEALPLLCGSGGAVVNITSDAAVEAYPGWGGYGASKAALEHISRVLAEEERDLRVWWFDPGDMRTRMHQEAFPGEDIGDRPAPETVVPTLLRLIDARPPSGRIRAAELTVVDR